MKRKEIKSKDDLLSWVCFSRMRSLLLRWETARVVHHDLWNIFIVLKAGGVFTKINSRTRQKVCHASLFLFFLSSLYALSCIGTLCDRRNLFFSLASRVFISISLLLYSCLSRLVFLSLSISALRVTKTISLLLLHL